MPRIFDNIEKQLLPALLETVEVAHRADFCVGYFNLRGWRHLASHIDLWEGGEGNRVRLLVGMQQSPHEELRNALGLNAAGEVDQQAALRLKKKLAEEFREQLTIGVPTNEDEAGLRQLAAQLKARKVVVRLFLRHPLHAKLYLLFRSDPVNPIVGYLGSSNLTLSGLSKQGELNIDVLDAINALNLPRYGLGNYIAPSPHEPPGQAEARHLQDLSRAGKRLMGFCRTNLFKRLESSDQDADDTIASPGLFDNGENSETPVSSSGPLRTDADFTKRSHEIYSEYSAQHGRRFKWLRPGLFLKTLAEDLEADAKSLIRILEKRGGQGPRAGENYYRASACGLFHAKLSWGRKEAAGSIGVYEDRRGKRRPGLDRPGRK